MLCVSKVAAGCRVIRLEGLPISFMVSVLPLLLSSHGAARAETEEFVEYDLDDEDEEWLESFNGHRNSLPAEKYAAIWPPCFWIPSVPRYSQLCEDAGCGSQCRLATPCSHHVGTRLDGRTYVRNGSLCLFSGLS